MATRNRVIYQSEALYVGQPEATGHHITAKSNNAADANGADVSSKVWGLVKEPDNITKKCIVDNTDFWSLITKPTDLIDAGGNAVAPFKGDFDSTVDYAVEDVVKVTDDGQDWYFEASQISGPSTAVKTPLVALADYTDNGNYDLSNNADLTDWDILPAVKQLNRVQSANYSFTINRQDVNQFGQLSRIDSVAIEPPTVSLDFSYYLTNGANESLMGFNLEDFAALDGGTAVNFVKTDKQEDDYAGRNYFILTTKQGTDAVGNNIFDVYGDSDDTTASTIALGNGYVTNYSVEASVGSMPTANVTVEGLNLKSDAGFHNIDIPAVNNERGTPIEGVKYSLPAPVSGVLDDSSTDPTLGDADKLSGQADGFSCLRPGDIEMHMGTDGESALMNTLPDGTPPTDHNPLSCHVQSFSIELPLSRTPLQRLGTPYAYTRPLDFPITVNVSVSAIVADLKAGNVADHLFNFQNHDLQFILREPQADGKGPIAMAFFVKGAQLEGESFSSSIGDNKSVDITFSCQIGGPEDTTRGIMIGGSRGPILSTFLDRFDPATK